MPVCQHTGEHLTARGRAKTASIVNKHHMKEKWVQQQDPTLVLAGEHDLAVLARVVTACVHTCMRVHACAHVSALGCAQCGRQGAPARTIQSVDGVHGSLMGSQAWTVSRPSRIQTRLFCCTRAGGHRTMSPDTH